MTTLVEPESQPELGTNTVSLRAQNQPMGGYLAFLDHLGLSTARNTQETTKNPLNGARQWLSPRVDCLPPGPGAAGRLLLPGWCKGWF
jgi:hypothetical protein